MTGEQKVTATLTKLSESFKAQARIVRAIAGPGHQAAHAEGAARAYLCAAEMVDEAIGTIEEASE